MELVVSRVVVDRVSSVGDMTVDGAPECCTLELPPGRCIPAGRYRVTVERSPRFSAMAGHDVSKPRLHDVPGFEGVLIHEGNTARDTEGCILVGKTKGQDEIGQSRDAYDRLFPKIWGAIARGEEVWLTVQNAA